MGVTQFDLPDLGEGLVEAEIVEWHVSPGDRVVADQPFVSVETDKAVVEIPAPWAGTVSELLAEAGALVSVGAPIARIDTAERPDTGSVVGGLETAEKGRAADKAAKAKQSAAGPGKAKPGAMPAARKLAVERGLDLSEITGSGPGGIITRADVEAWQGAPPDAGWEPLSGPRRAMAARMTIAAEVVRATVQDVADVSEWMGAEADPLSRLVRATARAAAEAPALNAWFDPKTQSRKHHRRVDLGIAVDTARGLYVPVLRDAAGRTPAELRAELDRLIAAARVHSLRQADQSEPTLTLSSFGSIGGRHAELVVIPPQVAILGAGRAYDALMPAPGASRPCKLLPLSLSFDHRAVTGGEAARFLSAVIADLERPD